MKMKLIVERVSNAEIVHPKVQSITEIVTNTEVFRTAKFWHDTIERAQENGYESKLSKKWIEQDVRNSREQTIDEIRSDPKYFDIQVDDTSITYSYYKTTYTIELDSIEELDQLARDFNHELIYSLNYGNNPTLFIVDMEM